MLGITGTGGSGKSSLTDELVRRLRVDQQDKLRVACVAIDPTRRRGGGALLGDRIRMNSLDGDRVYFRSLATRGGREVPEALGDVLTILKAAGFDLVVVETPGIGQGDAAITSFADVNLYVMTPEFGAASQLEKIDMLDFADVVAINKFERRGAMDALRDVGRQMVRNRGAFGKKPDDMPVFGTSAATFNDDGVTALYQELRRLLAASGLEVSEGALTPVGVRHSSVLRQVVPPRRVRYLAEIAETVRGYHDDTRRYAEAARRVQRLTEVGSELERAGSDRSGVDALLGGAQDDLPLSVARQLAGWSSVVEAYSGDEQVITVRDKEIHTSLVRESLSGNRIRRVSLPRYSDDGDLVSFLRRENLPGYFPFTAGVFPFKRDNEDPARMFAGEGDPFRTNTRFKMLSEGQPATRLSTAFDSVTLYGRDPDKRPDIYGKVGTSGVSVATLDDMRELYAGFDLTSPTTSVSMTINGPAPTILAFFLNTVMDREVEAWVAREGREPSEQEADGIRATALATVRGTVQADILKEDQGQNTCLFSTEFSLRMMADIQEWFIAQKVRNFYSVSISGYHIAEAGANPISQLAFTLANGFTYVEAYLARGMDIDDFAPNLSFFFSNGMDPEYTVIGRVARRIWAIAMKEKYDANERSQKLKYHVQTSGRSLHAQEMDFNDIRTTLQALVAIYDNANSLHTNAYDEAVTTPSEESVRRALAIQMIINKEWGLAAQREPAAGCLRRRRADRPRRGRRARRVRPHLRARRGARSDGDRLPARPDPGRVDALRAPQARRLAPDRRRQHLPQPGCRWHPARGRARPGVRGREGGPARAGHRLQGGAPGGGRGGAGAAQGLGDVRRERLRRAHGCRPRVFAAAGHRGVLRGGRAVPPQRLTRPAPLGVVPTIHRRSDRPRRRDTPGIGQGDAAITSVPDVRLRSVTREGRGRAAGEDRHARLRRRAGQQQGEAPRRRGTPCGRGRRTRADPRRLRQGVRRTPSR